MFCAIRIAQYRAACQAVLEDLGGLSELEAHEDRFVIRGCSCPFGTLVGHHPEICHLAERLLAELLDLPVQQQCQPDGEDGPQCMFEIMSGASSGS